MVAAPIDPAVHRRQTIRRGRRSTARWQADTLCAPRRAALEAADLAEANGMPAEAAYQRQLADALIPEHLRWAFTNEHY